MDDRIIIVTNDDLRNNPIGASTVILAVMLFPESEEARKSFINSYVKKDLNDSSTETRAHYLRTESEYAARLFGQVDDDKFYSTVRSRKTGGASLARKGVLSGHILMHVLNPSIGSLELAYDEIQKRFDHHADCGGRISPGQHRPTKPLLRSIWRNYKHISHLWAAHCALFLSNGINIFSPTWHGDGWEALTPHITLFVGLASYARKRLIESTNSYTGIFHIDGDGRQVWSILDEHMKPHQPCEIFFGNF